MMNKEQLIILREFVWQLNKSDPRVLTKILERMGTKTEILDEVMKQLDKEIDTSPTVGELFQQWREAYKKAYGEYPVISDHGGW